MTISIAGLTIEQNKSGLYSINDLHRASGGLLKHRPENWFRLQSTTNFIRYQEEKAKSQGINQGNGVVIETFVGGDVTASMRGTYVSRKLVVSYAMWISPAFADHVLDTFLDVVDGVYERVNAQNKVIEQQTLQLDIFTGELASMRKRDPRGKNTLPVLTGTEAHQAKPLFDKLEADGYVIKREYMPTRTQYVPTDKAYDEGLIIGVKNRTIHFTSKVLQVLEMEVQS